MTNKLNGMLPKIAVGLATAGILGALGAWGQQQGMAENVEANGEAAKVCCEKAHANENDITVIATEWRIFQLQYNKDQLAAASERKAILKAVNR